MIVAPASIAVRVPVSHARALFLLGSMKISGHASRAAPRLGVVHSVCVLPYSQRARYHRLRFPRSTFS